MPRGVSFFDPMWIRPKEEDVRARHDEALALLEQGDLEGARRIAQELRAIGWAGAFEVLALALRAERDLGGAIAVLEEGCALAPDAWSLHELRGTLLDATGEHTAAIEAYERALACEGAWAASVRYNRAIARLRAGDPGGALADAEAALGGASPPPFAIDAVEIAIDALDRLGRRDDAVSLVRGALGETEDDDGVAGRLRGLLAIALGRAGDLEGAGLHARRAVEAGHGSASVARWLAPIDHDARPARSLRLVVQGRTCAGAFLRVLGVWAADAEEALRWARELEPLAERAALSAESCTDGDLPTSAADARRGVVFASARLPFDES